MQLINSFSLIFQINRFCSTQKRNILKSELPAAPEIVGTLSCIAIQIGN